MYFKTKQMQLIICLATFKSGCISFLSGNVVKIYIMGRLPSQEIESQMNSLAPGTFCRFTNILTRMLGAPSLLSVLASSLPFLSLAITSCSEEQLSISKESASFSAWLTVSLQLIFVSLFPFFHKKFIRNYNISHVHGIIR